MERPFRQWTPDRVTRPPFPRDRLGRSASESVQFTEKSADETLW